MSIYLGVNIDHIATLREALMRYLIAHHLADKPLYTRQLLVELNQSGTQ